MGYSQNEYKRLGERIRQNPDNISENDLEMLQELRLSFKEDLSAVFNVLVEEASEVDRKSIRTYRIKRIESIVSKLLRVPKMQLQRMSDVAGCRCIMKNDKKVYALYERLKERFIVRQVNDYIAQPKDTGYRSLHLIVQPGESSKRTIEIQLRSVEEHNWATLVEITDLLYHSRIKETGAGHELAEFHRMLSTGTTQLDMQQKKKLINIAKRHDYFFKLSAVFSKNYIKVRDQWNKAKQSKNSFFLVSTGDDGEPEILAFRNFDKAEEQYFIMYNQNSANKNIVLTHIHNATFDDISMAYSNYFLTYNELFFKCHRVISDIVVNAYRKHNVVAFYKNYKFFWELTRHMMGVQIGDSIEMENKRLMVPYAKKSQWQSSIRQHIDSILKVLNDTNAELRNSNHRFLCTIAYIRLFKKYTRMKIVPYTAN